MIKKDSLQNNQITIVLFRLRRMESLQFSMFRHLIIVINKWNQEMMIVSQTNIMRLIVMKKDTYMMNGN